MRHMVHLHGIRFESVHYRWIANRLFGLGFDLSSYPSGCGIDATVSYGGCPVSSGRRANDLSSHRHGKIKSVAIAVAL